MRIMRDSRNGSYATMGAGLWVVAKSAAIAHLAGPGGVSVWKWGASVGAGPAIVVAQCVARASAAPLIFSFKYILEDHHNSFPTSFGHVACLYHRVSLGDAWQVHCG